MTSTAFVRSGAVASPKAPIRVPAAPGPQEG